MAATRKAKRANAGKLTEAIRSQLVDKFACFEDPVEILAWLKEVHGITVQRSALAHYDLDTEWGRKQSAAKWGEQFKATRAAFLAAEREQAISHRTYRLAVAQRRIRALLARGTSVNDRVILQYLEFAAKEEGGFFTNKRVIEADPRGALARLLGLSPEDLPGADAAQP